MPDPQPTIQINNPPASQSPDHDLLLTFKAEVSTKLDRVISDVKDLKNDSLSRVATLEEEKASEKDFIDYCEKNDARYDQLSKLVYIGLGIVIALDFAVIAYLTYFRK